jgi:hypothetical protein
MKKGIRSAKKIIGLMAILAVVFFVPGCNRDNDTVETALEGINFHEDSKTISIGEVVTIGMNVRPLEAKQIERMSYSVSVPGIVEIKEASSNDGVVIEGKARGNVVVIGRMKGFTSYCTVTVGGGGESMIPHIVSPVTVLEIPKGER